MNSNWKVVTGDDGQQYYEVSGQVYLSPNTMSPNQDGAAFVAIPVGTYGGIPVVTETRGYDEVVQFGGGVARRDYYPEPSFTTDTAVAFQRWLPGDPDGGSLYDPPSGRFRNLNFP